MAFGLAFVLVLTLLAFGLPVGPSLKYIVDGAFGDKVGVARTLVKAVPLLLTGLGMMFAWRSGMYNIGGEGQFIAGGLAGATMYKLASTLPPPLATPVIVVAAVMGGAAFAAFAGWLQIRRGVPLVISTILLNFIALQALDWACAGPLKAAQNPLPQTERLPAAIMLTRFDRATDLHSGAIALVIAPLLAWGFLMRTRPGFSLRAVGANPRFARANGIPVERTQLAAVALSGAFCGLAAGVEYLGLQGQLSTSFSLNWGFVAIPVALLGGLHPIGVLASALYFGALLAGTQRLAQYSPAGTTIVLVIQGVAVLAFMAMLAWLPKPKVVPEGEELSPA